MAHTRVHLETLIQVMSEAVSLGSIGHLPHKVILLRLGDIADLPNT